MKKYIRKHIKDEKRILKLMYKKGILCEYVKDYDHSGWEQAYEGKRGRKRERKNRYALVDWLPQFHLSTWDYWGEGDSHSIIEAYQKELCMENASYCKDEGFINTNKKALSKKWLIKHLNSMRTVNNDSFINKYLKISL